MCLEKAKKRGSFPIWRCPRSQSGIGQTAQRHGTSPTGSCHWRRRRRWRQERRLRFRLRLGVSGGTNADASDTSGDALCGDHKSKYISSIRLLPNSSLKSQLRTYKKFYSWMLALEVVNGNSPSLTRPKAHGDMLSNAWKCDRHTATYLGTLGNVTDTLRHALKRSEI